MKEVKRSALVPYSPKQMYELVNDVALYGEFLPWCKSTKVLESSEQLMVASIEISKMGVTKAFTTRNTLAPNERIDMQLVDGPLKRLHGYWLFQDIQGQGCKVILDLTFEVENSFAGKALQKILSSIADTLVDAFCERARQLYGKA